MDRVFPGRMLSNDQRIAMPGVSGTQNDLRRFEKLFYWDGFPDSLPGRRVEENESL